MGNEINYKFWKEISRNFDRLRRRKPNYKNWPSEVLAIGPSLKLITEGIEGNNPFFAGKLGESELEVLRNYFALKRSSGKSKLFKIIDFLKYTERFEWTGLNTIVRDSGFFPEDNSLLERFSESYTQTLKNLDVFATADGLSGWHGNKREDLVIRWTNDKVAIVTKDALAPIFDIEKSWTHSLRNKKILVIHPFEDSIKEGYKNREHQFPKTLLPNFELLTYKPVQSIAYTPTEYSNWFEALEKMQNDISEIDFEIALIGCGAYGLPLGSFIKNMGKRAIHIGGALQLLFGIKGNRWDKHAKVRAYYNEFWKRPFTEERPANAGAIGIGTEDYW